MYLTILWVLLWTSDTTFKCVCIYTSPQVFLFLFAFIRATEDTESWKMKEWKRWQNKMSVRESHSPLGSFYLCGSMSIRTIRPQTFITPMSDFYFQHNILSLNCILFLIYFSLLTFIYFLLHFLHLFIYFSLCIFYFCNISTVYILTVL